MSSRFVACASLKGPPPAGFAAEPSPSLSEPRPAVLLLLVLSSYTALRFDGPREERFGRSGLFRTDEAIVAYGFGLFPAGDALLDCVSDASKKGLSEG